MAEPELSPEPDLWILSSASAIYLSFIAQLPNFFSFSLQLA